MLKDVAARAGETRIFLGVYHPGSATTPLTTDARAQFASYVAAIVRDVPAIGDVIVGNEPNLNRFWLPQFDEAGNDVAAPAYFALLAEVYDAAKGVDEDVTDLGRRARPRAGSTGPAPAATPTPRRRSSATSAPPTARAAATTRRSTASPSIRTRRARASRPTAPPTPRRSRSCMADYEEKLRPLLDEAFGPGLPVLYSELGVETAIPPAKASLYEGTEPGEPVDEATQADYYRRAIELACLPGERRRPAALPLTRRAGADRLPVRRLLRRRHAEGELRARARRDSQRRVLSTMSA